MAGLGCCCVANLRGSAQHSNAMAPAVHCEMCASAKARLSRLVQCTEARMAACKRATCAHPLPDTRRNLTQALQQPCLNCHVPS